MAQPHDVPRLIQETPRWSARGRPAFVAGALVFLLALAAAVCIIDAEPAYAADATLETELGIGRDEFVESIKENWTDNHKYKNTIYTGWDIVNDPYPSWNTGPWWPRGLASPTGAIGMNCGGFVSRALMDAGATTKSSTFMKEWWDGSWEGTTSIAAGHFANARTFLRLAQDRGLKIYKYVSASQTSENAAKNRAKDKLLAAGHAEKGDIIVSIDDTDTGGYDDYGRWQPHQGDSHIGIFWGDSSDEDLYMHCAHDVDTSATSTVSGCVVSSIQPKCWGATMYLVKFDLKGWVEIEKSSASPDDTDGDDDYSLKGAEYGVYDSDDKLVDTIVTDEKGYGKSKRLAAGSYTLKETKASKGFMIDETEYNIKVSVGKGTTKKVKEQPENGRLEIEKESGAESISDGNAMYSLKGAVYGVYDSDDKEVARITLNSKGKGSAENIKVGKYTVREIEPPEGFSLSSNKYNVTIKGGKTTEKKVTDNPKNDPTGLKIVKIDSTTGKASPQGSASLAGAEFTFKYYDGYYTEENLPDKAERTWVMKTDENGATGIGNDFEALKVSGGDFYRNTKDNVTLPLGTLTFVETKAPSGYNLGSEEGQNPKLHVLQIVENPDGTTLALKKYVNFEPDEELGNVRSVADQVSRGNISLGKRDDELARSSGKAQGDASLAGARYDVINRSDSPVVSPVDGKSSIAAGDVVCTIVTDEFGNASTTSADLNGWTIPDSWEGFALAYGTYEVREQSASSGYLVNVDWSETIDIVSNGKTMTVETTEHPREGGFELYKFDRDKTDLGPEGDATLAGAQFEIVNSSSGPVVSPDNRVIEVGGVVETISTDESGYASTGERDLPFGTYTVRESKTSQEGYLYDDTSKAWKQTFEIREDGQLQSLNTHDKSASNLVMRGNISLSKADRDTQANAPQGDSSLAGAVYDIVNRSGSAVVSPQTGKAVAPGAVVCSIVTDAEGFASTTRADLNGWTIPDSWNGKALAYGTYEVVESGSAHGYLVNSDFKADVQIRNDNQTVQVKTDDSVERGRVIVGKTSRENKAYKPQGAGTLEGAVFEITNKSKHPVVVDGASHKPGEAVMHITTKLVDGKYIADTGERCLPYGTYSIHEIETSQGYLLDETSKAWEKSFEIRKDGQLVDFSKEADSHPEQIIRADFSFTKVSAPKMKRMKNIPFKVTSLTTGEWHILVTDENGMADTAADWIVHDKKANSNDKALDSKGVVDPEKLDPSCGIWFDGRTDAKTSIDNGKGALPYDTYQLDELSVPSNDGYELVSFQIRLDRDHYHYELGTIDDEQGVGPSISTTLEDADGSKVVAAISKARLVDTVEYVNLADEPYLLVGNVHLVEGGEAGQVVATAEKKFTPKLRNGHVEVEFEIDTSQLGGKSLVCFEELYDNAGRLVATHADAKDNGQTVSVPEIETTLSDAASGTNCATTSSSGSMSLVDTVEYDGLVPGKTYAMTGTLHDKETGKMVLNSYGAPVTSTSSFVPEHSSGSLQITFDFSNVELQGAAVVAFESLTYQGVEYAVHADIKDEAQTVYVPRISTSLENEMDHGHLVPEAGSVDLVDNVQYENLAIGIPHTATASLYNRQTGQIVLDGEGAPVESSITFTPESRSGSVSVPIKLDASLLPDETVCFEKIVNQLDHEVARHEDLSDEGQTVRKPHIATTLTDAPSSTHVAEAAQTYRLCDSVEYDNLVPGSTYTVTGTLYDKLTGEPALDTNGNAITSTCEFVPESESGTTEVLFEFEKADAPGTALVAFESLEFGGREFAAHADLTDEAQTVYIPKIHTTLVDSSSNSHVAFADGSYHLVDTVAYSGLEPGATYTITGHLVDKGTSEPVSDRQSAAVTSSATIVAEESSGEAVIAFDFEADIAGKSVVAFEQLSSADGRVIALHENIDDLGQTVSIPFIQTTLLDSYSQTHEAFATEYSKLVDTVEYAGLDVGTTYLLTGVLMDRETGSELVGTEAEPIKAELFFTPDEPSGSVELPFKFDSRLMTGKTVVAFETLVHEGRAIATHDDLDDEGQSVHFPSIGTMLTDSTTNLHAGSIAQETTSLKDTVAYANLDPDAEYVLTGVLHVRNEDGSDAGPLATATQTGSQASLTFKPEEANGTVDLPFSIDTPSIAGKTVVAFETLTRKDSGTVSAVHEEIDDEGQTVRYPLELRTTASSVDTGTFLCSLDEHARIRDTVSYSNLDTDQRYVLRATLHAKGDSGEDLGPVSQNGSVLEKKLEFNPSEPNGEEEMELELDTTSLDVASLVFFESLELVDGTPVTSHEDISDEGQTVHTAKISTTALDKSTGSHEAAAEKTVTIVDKVEYTGLEPGCKYLLTGTLYDKASGKPISDGQVQVVGERTFTAKADSGYEEMEFVVPGDSVRDKVVVVFEQLAMMPDDGEGVTVAKHEDIDSDAQSVSYHTPPQGETFAKTGLWLSRQWLLVLCLIVATAFIALYDRIVSGNRLYSEG